MRRRKEGFMSRIMRARLLKNKIMGLTLLIIGYWSIYTTGNITVSLLMIMFALPLLFAKENVIG